MQVKFKNEEWTYNPDGHWGVYEEGLSNGQLWRMSGKNCQEVLREGISFNKEDLEIIDVR